MAAIPDAADTRQLTRRGLRLLVVDDHELILWGTRVLLCRLSWVQRCVQASTSEQALEYAGRYRPHVAIVDLMIGGQSGLELCAALRRTAPDTKVLLTSGIGEVSRARAVAAGAVGYLPKESDTDELLRAIRVLHAGDTWFPAERPAQRPVGELSQREREVLELMALAPPIARSHGGCTWPPTRSSSTPRASTASWAPATVLRPSTADSRWG